MNTEAKKIEAKSKREEKKRLEALATKKARQKFLNSREERTKEFWTKALELYVKKLTSGGFFGRAEVPDVVTKFLVNVDHKQVVFNAFNVVRVETMMDVDAGSEGWFENQISELNYVETMMNLEIQREKDRCDAELRKKNLRKDALAKLSKEEREALGL